MRSPTVVRIAGAEFRDGDGVLLSANVVLAEGKTRTSSTIVLADPLKRVVTLLPLPSEDARVPVEVFAGEKLFTGYLARTAHSQSSGSPGRLTLTASDTFSSSRKSSNARVLTDASAAQQIRILAEAAEQSVRFHGDSEAQLDQVQYGQRVQRGISDAALLQETLDALGHTYQVRGNTLHIREIGAAAENDLIELTMGTTGTIESISFSVKEIDRNTTPNVYSRAGDRTFEQDLKLDPDVQERSVRLERTGVLFDAADLPSFTDQTLEQAMRAQARAKKLQTCQITLTALNDAIDVDSQVLLRGQGRFTGIWNVEQVTHSLSPLRRTSLSLFNGGSEDSGGSIAFIGDQVLFDFDVDMYASKYDPVLDRVAARLATYKDTVVVVTGHADEVGTDSYNLDLALRRATNVYNGLITRGVAASRLSVVTKGESEPVSSDRALNRRVNFVVK